MTTSRDQAIPTPDAYWVAHPATRAGRLLAGEYPGAKDPREATRKLGRFLDAIDAALGRGETVYVHCFGGVGRTGTVVGCWLARHGSSGEAALRQVVQWREGTPDGGRVSPETPEQRRMVLSWKG